MDADRQKVGNLASVRRLPAYLYLLRQLQENGREVVSSTYIAEKLRLEAIQVRKDLAVTGNIGKPKVGYYVPTLIQAIEHFLGWDNDTDAFLVGAGNLGSALLGYQGLAKHGLNIVAAFDTDPAKIGTQIHGRDVLPLEKLSDLVGRMHITMGIVAVPAEAAQSVVELMVASGITAIWNYSPTHLDVPKNIAVQNEDLASGLAVLSVKAASVRNAQAPTGGQ